MLEVASWGQGLFGNPPPPEQMERPPLEATTKQRQLGSDYGH
jgi:hypothetical protein